eukprot:CAMPEP_0174362688 /NCGR_PEP_ID=MMETSP0811_2-20130205/65594_1 /TAXON_ID=73025 ORGANISM="Eutreptiella gymnastica-like, Strain CCMP1594" /NCGR_SAMPLE_ID=MMETSP0811_2 /ASSEMBLY_ACC=CAM_ASM_000667 /LENGTH=68 /DNA_ID=CAMNT_0015500643 /DNA_START=440 /DNA_END=643 /DNA_ORIENTATION=-
MPQLKPILLDNADQVIQTQLHTDLPMHFRKMVQQWAIVDPHTPVPQAMVDSLHVLKDVVGCVNEEARG